MHNKIKQIL